MLGLLDLLTRCQELGLLGRGLTQPLLVRVSISLALQTVDYSSGRRSCRPGALSCWHMWSSRCFGGMDSRVRSSRRKTLSYSCKLGYINEWSLDQAKKCSSKSCHGCNATSKLVEVVEVKIRYRRCRFTPAKSSLETAPSPAALWGRAVIWLPFVGTCIRRCPGLLLALCSVDPWGIATTGGTHAGSSRSFICTSESECFKSTIFSLLI